MKEYKFEQKGPYENFKIWTGQSSTEIILYLQSQKSVEIFSVENGKATKLKEFAFGIELKDFEFVETNPKLIIFKDRNNDVLKQYDSLEI